MPTSSTSKYEERPGQTQNSSDNADHHSFPPLQPQSEIGRRYPVGPVTGLRENLLKRLKKLLPSRTPR